jgi:N-acetylneuraminic acid mutarotase
MRRHSRTFAPMPSAGLLLTLLACADGEPLGPRVPAPAAVATGWSTRAPMPTARERFAAVVVDGALYAVGGQSDASLLATVEAYAPGNDAWTARASLPEPRSHLNAGVIKGVLYAAGGLDAAGEPTATLYAYDPKTNGWITKASMPVAGACGASGVIDDRLYVFTTSCSESDLGGDPAFQRYDPKTDSWTALTLPTWGHFLPAAGVLGGKFYLAGGLFATTDPIGNIGQNVEAYDPATDSWTTKAKAPSVRYQDAGAVLNGRLYVVGGGTGTEYQDLLDVYDPRTDSWLTLADMPTARGFLAAAALGGKVYAMGGLTLDGYVATNEVYIPRP